MYPGPARELRPTLGGLHLTEGARVEGAASLRSAAAGGPVWAGVSPRCEVRHSSRLSEFVVVYSTAPISQPSLMGGGHAALAVTGSRSGQDQGLTTVHASGSLTMPLEPCGWACTSSLLGYEVRLFAGPSSPGQVAVPSPPLLVACNPGFWHVQYLSLPHAAAPAFSGRSRACYPEDSPLVPQH